MAFSRRHYRFVSPREDTPERIASGNRLNALIAQATAEMQARFPIVTVENFAEAKDWHGERISELRREAGI